MGGKRIFCYFHRAFMVILKKKKLLHVFVERSFSEKIRPHSFENVSENFSPLTFLMKTAKLFFVFPQMISHRKFFKWGCFSMFRHMCFVL